MIYADHAATTRLSEKALEAMEPYLHAEYGNPSTLYSLAREPRKAIASARETIAACIGANAGEIYFTSGGTEADNWALAGASLGQLGSDWGIATSSIEHHAVLNTCDYLRRIGIKVKVLPVDAFGTVSAETLDKCLGEARIGLVSIMMANNEIGTVQPVAELSDIAHRHGCLFHSDAVQAVGHIPVDVNEMGIDMLSASAHKFNGPKGVGFLYVRDGLAIEPFMHGGAQESGMRAGTENVPGIVGMAAALREHCENLGREMAYLNDLSSILLDSLRDSGIDFILNGSKDRIPGNLSLSFRDSDGEMLLHRLDLMGTEVATGSACNSKETELSHVIQAIGVPDEYAHGTIRISLGMDNHEEQMKALARQISGIIGAERLF